MEKYKIEPNSVEETLLIPLFGRKMCNKRFPNLYYDAHVEQMIQNIDYDFSLMEKKANNLTYQFGALEVAMRESDLLWEAKEYLKLHPKATIVNLGCGLSTLAESADNGTCQMVNIDYPDVIALRERLLPPKERTIHIGMDLNDLNWMKQVPQEDGVCLLAAGVFYYFTREQLKKLFGAMISAFPGRRLVFDSAGKTAVKMMLKTWIKEAGITSIDQCSSVDDISKDLAPMVGGCTISSRGYMTGYNDLSDPSVPSLFRILGKVGDRFMKMRIIRMDFQ